MKPKFNLKGFLGLCNHKWKYIRTESGPSKVKEVCECQKCGKRKGFEVW